MVNGQRGDKSVHDPGKMPPFIGGDVEYPGLEAPRESRQPTSRRIQHRLRPVERMDIRLRVLCQHLLRQQPFPAAKLDDLGLAIACGNKCANDAHLSRAIGHEVGSPVDKSLAQPFVPFLRGRLLRHKMISADTVAPYATRST